MKTKILCFTVLNFFFLTFVCFAQDLIFSGDIESGWHYIHRNISMKDTTTIQKGTGLDLITSGSIKFHPGFKVMPGGVLFASTSPDTDGDKIHDLIEDRTCTNFYIEDTDGDGLSDSFEDANRNGVWDKFLKETSPCDVDSDGDGIDDKWEIDHRLNPLFDDANEDPDGDKLSNYLEYYFDNSEHPSDPQDGTSLPPKGSYYVYDELGRVKQIVRIK